MNEAYTFLAIGLLLECSRMTSAAIFFSSRRTGTGTGHFDVALELGPDPLDGDDVFPWKSMSPSTWVAVDGVIEVRRGRREAPRTPFG